jgi:hypothetical protein
MEFHFQRDIKASLLNEFNTKWLGIERSSSRTINSENLSNQVVTLLWIGMVGNKGHAVIAIRMSIRFECNTV